MLSFATVFPGFLAHEHNLWIKLPWSPLSHEGSESTEGPLVPLPLHLSPQAS